MGCVFILLLLIFNFALQPTSAVYADTAWSTKSAQVSIKAVANGETTSPGREYLEMNVAAGKFTSYLALQTKSRETCAIHCLNQADNKCNSFKVDSDNGVLMCKLGTLGQIRPSDGKGEEIFQAVDWETEKTTTSATSTTTTCSMGKFGGKTFCIFPTCFSFRP